MFPALPTLLISARHLDYLCLSDIPVSGFTSPEVMANCLSTLPNLHHLTFGIQLPHGYHDSS